MPRYEFADQAEFDLETIIDYTLDRWEKTQAEDYLEGLEKLAQYLADSPDLGMDRNTLIEGLISFPYISHILYYIKQQHGITIIRVLHKRMDPKRHIMPGSTR